MAAVVFPRKGEAVTIRYRDQEKAGKVLEVSPAPKGTLVVLGLDFDAKGLAPARLGMFVGVMPVLIGEDGACRDLLLDEPVEIVPRAL